MILKRGDRIHICVPESLGMRVSQVQEFRDLYASYGVSIASMSTSNTITHPVIIAVFREGSGS